MIKLLFIDTSSSNKKKHKITATILVTYNIVLFGAIEMTIVLKFLPFPKRRNLQPSQYRQYISKMNWGQCKLYLS